MVEDCAYEDFPARQGCQVVIPYREEMAKRHLKVTGDLGRVTFIVCVPAYCSAG